MRSDHFNEAHELHPGTIFPMGWRRYWRSRNVRQLIALHRLLDAPTRFAYTMANLRRRAR